MSKAKTEKKPKYRPKTLSRLMKSLMEQKGLMALALLLSFVGNVFGLLGPRYSGYAVDNMLGPENVQFEKVIFYCLLMIGVYLLSSLLGYVLAYIMMEVSKRITYNLRKNLFDHIMSLPISYFDTHATGDIISKIMYDVDTVNTSLSSDLVVISSNVISVIGSFIMMVTISPYLVTVFLITVPISILLSKKLTSITRPIFAERSGKLGELNGYVEEMVSGQKTFKAYNQERNVINKFKEKNKITVDAYYRADYYGSMVGPAVNSINNLSLTLISVVGAIFYMFGGISLGNISSFVLYSRKFSGPINEVANIMQEFQSALAAADRIFRLLDELPETPDSEKAIVLENVYGRIEAENVAFGYSEDKIVLKNLNFKAEKGSVTAIVGPTGAGKTTLINLLMRFYDVNTGAIYIDGNEIREITRNSLRGAYSMVLQDTWLFEGTIYENIAYGNPNATKEDVEKAAKAAKLHRYIMQLPKGYDTVIIDEGTNLSKGQKQLMTIARAMLLDSKMLILDEATSNVDTRTEIEIQEAMLKLMQNKTCFVIAHRLSTIRNADEILVINEGDIVEQGTHDQLMAKEGFYSRMFYAQFD